MPRFLLGWLLGLGGAAVGLVLATLILPNDQFDFTSISGFLWSIVLYAILSVIFTWFVAKALIRHAGSIIALTGLISAFLALLVTNLVVSGISISGWGWFWATLIVWLCGMLIWLIPGPWRNFDKGRVRA